MERWINVQPNGGIKPGDNLSAFSGALAILDWQVPCDNGLTFVNVPIKVWRWTQDPRQWQDWPHKYLVRCDLAMFANEPDLEGFPAYYNDVCNAWVHAGGTLCAPAYSNEYKRLEGERRDYAYYSWHDYAGEFHNRAALVARNFGKPIIGTEYGVAHNQNKSVSDLLQIPEPVALFIWRWSGNSAAGYDIADVAMEDSMVLKPVMQEAGSPNYWKGRDGQTIDAIVYHGTAGPGAVSWFQNPVSQVSAHFVIALDGTITQCVDLNNSAWHAGVVTADSIYAGRPNPNLWTIGIEHERDKSNTSQLTQYQIDSSRKLTQWLRSLYPGAQPILHDAIDVGRVCPGPDFPLQQIWNGDIVVSVEPVKSSVPDTSDLQAQAYYFQHGYKVDTGHALWSECLLPLYQEWQRLVTAGSPLADAVCPGPLVSGESSTFWGVDTEAAFVKTENSAYGVRHTAGKYLPYRLRVY